LSGEYVEKLKRRARVFLREAMSVGDPDLAAFFAEQAMQLYIKAVYYELFGDLIRGHKLRELISILARSLDKHGFNDIANKLREFVEEFRRALILGEEAYTAGRYGEISYNHEEAGEVIRAAEKFVEILDEVVKRVKLG
jgi:HEPN domain-containing protein